MKGYIAKKGNGDVDLGDSQRLARRQASIEERSVHGCVAADHGPSVLLQAGLELYLLPSSPDTRCSMQLSVFRRLVCITRTSLSDQLCSSRLLSGS